MATTQFLSRLSKRDFWTLFWPAYQAAFTAKNIGSGWKCTGLLPFDPEVVLSEIRLPASIAPMPADDVDTSLALEKPTARQIRQLTTKVVGKMHQNLDIGARKLVNTIESLQAQVEILQHENKGLRQTIHLEKTRRQRGKPLKHILFDIEDANEAIIYSPAKIARARERMAEMDRGEQDRALQKEVQKAARAQAAQEKKDAIADRKRLREEEKERKRLITEQKKGERELARQLRYDLQKGKAEKARLAKKGPRIGQENKGRGGKEISAQNPFSPTTFPIPYIPFPAKIPP